ncbi:MAG: RAMP superfamily CRISPR-associated protein [Pseudomonadota bacterium]
MRVFKAEISAQVKTQAPMHIGSGTVRMRPPASDKDKETTVAMLQRDAAEHPFIPGSTLKGALRAGANAPALGEKDVFGIDGPAPEEGTTGEGDHARQGKLTFLNAYCAGKPAALTVDRTKVGLGTGAAEANKLFSFDMVPDGTAFDVKILAHGSSREEIEALARAAAALLSVFRQEGGLPLGRGKANYAGSLTLEGEISAQIAAFTPGGWANFEPFDVGEVSVPEKAFEMLPLSCPGPYISKGTFKEEPRVDDPAKTKKVQLPARAAGGETPGLSEAGVRGALRARAEWIVALARHRGETHLDAKESCKTTSGQKTLDVVERVFGTEGRQSLLDLRITGRTRAGASRHPGVRLDPITQAPYEGDDGGALYELEADYGVSFELHHRWRKSPTTDEKALLKALLEDIKANGLKLGHNTTNGFGWFNCAPVDGTGNFGKRDAPINARTCTDAELKAHCEKEKWEFPSKQITLPWRSVPIDPKLVPPMEDEVEKAYLSAGANAARTGLHVSPLEGGICGHIDLSWVFETPVLIGDGGAIRSPQGLGERPATGGFYLPGSTLRGYVRNIVTAAVNGRLTHVLKPVPAENQQDCLLREPYEELMGRGRMHTPHNPKPDAGFRPDFVQALFGFILEPEAGAPDPLHHDLAHLKSRVSFGFAGLESDATTTRQETVTLTAPQANSYLYDGIGIKRYVPGLASADEAHARLKEVGKTAGRDEMTSQVSFLEPTSGDPLVFRGRIAFHNVTMAELGAVIWALLCGNQKHGRHYLGTGRPFGFGCCYCADLSLHYAPNSQVPQPALQKVGNTEFGGEGLSLVAPNTAFTGALKAKFLHPTLGTRINALRRSFDPIYAEALRRRTDLGDKQMHSSPGYQTISKLERNFHAGFSGKKDKVQEIARENMPERLASLLGKQPF